MSATMSLLTLPASRSVAPSVSPFDQPFHLTAHSPRRPIPSVLPTSVIICTLAGTSTVKDTFSAMPVVILPLAPPRSKGTSEETF